MSDLVVHELGRDGGRLEWVDDGASVADGLLVRINALWVTDSSSS